MDIPLQSGITVTLEESAAHYIREVLRLKPDMAVSLFNGRGGEYAASIEKVTRRSVSIAVKEWSGRECESALKIILGIGISRGERMDFAIQKAVELGVYQICPLLTERSVVQLKNERKQRKLQHWERVACSACEQCGRNYVPQITVAEDFDTWLGNARGLKLFCNPDSDRGIAQLQLFDETIVLLSGPEGGFSKAERQKASDAGFIAINLGPRILRTETAAVAAISAIQALWGDLGPSDSSM